MESPNSIKRLGKNSIFKIKEEKKKMIFYKVLKKLLYKIFKKNKF